jgi:hypothetical protein
MNRSLAYTILAVLAFLDYAALDDITTGVEPNFTAEWVMLVVSVPITWLLIRRLRKPAPSASKHAQS